MSNDDECLEFDKIEADFIVVQVTDKHSGQVFTRQLPIKYFENCHGVVLAGENIAGAPVEIAFYSDSALAKICDLTGKGLDKPRCNHG